MSDSKLRLRRRIVRAAALVIALVAGGGLAAHAGDFYVAASMATTLGTVDPHGDNGDRNATNPNVRNHGMDTDWSPVIAGIVGFEFPMRQALPRRYRPPRWMPDVDLEEWGIRTELEINGGRNYDVSIGASGLAPHHVTVSQWAMTTNVWLELPLGHGLEGMGVRMRGLRDLTFNTGVGIGYQRTRVESSSFDARGSHEDNLFLWHVGFELGIPLGRNLVLTGGYRYVPVGRLENQLTDSTQTQDFGLQKLDVAGHEFRTSLRLRFWSVRFPRGFLDDEGSRYEP